jgi:hypothetical protein
MICVICATALALVIGLSILGVCCMAMTPAKGMYDR